MLDLYVTSPRKLRVQSRPDETRAESLPATTAANIERAILNSPGAGLLNLGTMEVKTALSPALAFVRGFAQLAVKG